MELGGRAFDVLMALIEADGTVGGKYELIGHAWPGGIERLTLDWNVLLASACSVSRDRPCNTTKSPFSLIEAVPA